jgi:hypothetical protein
MPVDSNNNLAEMANDFVFGSRTQPLRGFLRTIRRQKEEGSFIGPAEDFVSFQSVFPEDLLQIALSSHERLSETFKTIMSHDHMSCIEVLPQRHGKNEETAMNNQMIAAIKIITGSTDRQDFVLQFWY